MIVTGESTRSFSDTGVPCSDTGFFFQKASHSNDRNYDFNLTVAVTMAEFSSEESCPTKYLSTNARPTEIYYYLRTPRSGGANKKVL
jgi:hypothetical protein